MKNLFYIFIIFLIHQSLAFAQVIGLEDVLAEARSSALGIKTAAAEIKQNEYEQQFFKSNLKPQFELSLMAPDYFKSSVPITQPNGIISFTDLSQNNASLGLNITQAIPWTGGRLFVSSELRRFDDFPNDITSYNGTPVSFGFIQPILGYNAFKYDQKILEARQRESIVRFKYAVEEAQTQATLLYFDILIAEENKKIAEINSEVNKNLLRITKERFLLGKASKNDELQLEMEVKRSALDLQQATLQYKNAILQLNNFLQTGYPTSGLSLQPPAPIETTIIDSDKAVQHALQTRPELETFIRQQQEVNAERARTKTEFGLNANLIASFGYARGSTNINDIYNDPKNAQSLQLTVSLPIIDWGLKKAAIGAIDVRQEIIETQLIQNKLNIANEVQTAINQFIQLQEAVKIMESISENALERFNISNERFVMGDISLTDLTIAQRENDQAKRNLVFTLRDYWVTYYQLRTLTGYDPIKNQEINYTTK